MSVDSIQGELLREIPDSYQKTAGFPTWTMTRAMSLGLDAAEREIAAAREKLDPENLSGQELEQFIYYRTGQSRVQATFAAGKVTVTGNGTVSAGDLFETAGGIQFRAGESVQVKGTAEVLVSCVTAGAAGNVAASTVTAMPVQIAGISAVTNPEPMTGGYDAESDKSLMERFLNQLQHPATSGNAWHYSEWAHEVAGVGEVKVFPLGHGAGTVDVVVLGADGKPASSEVVKQVQDYIDPGSRGDGMGAAPIGAKCYVSAAAALTVAVSVTIHTLPGSEQSAVTQAVKDSLAAYLAGIAFRQDYVSYAKMAETILGTAGVKDLENLRLGGGTANVPVGERQAAVLGEVNVQYAA